MTSNTLTIKPLQEGIYNITLTKGGIYSHPTYFFNSPNSQNMMTTGNIDNVYAHLKVIVKQTRLTITKIDYDNSSTFLVVKRN